MESKPKLPQVATCHSLRGGTNPLEPVFLVEWAQAHRHFEPRGIQWDVEKPTFVHLPLLEKNEIDEKTYERDE